MVSALTGMKLPTDAIGSKAQAIAKNTTGLTFDNVVAPPDPNAGKGLGAERLKERNAELRAQIQLLDAQLLADKAGTVEARIQLELERATTEQQREKLGPLTAETAELIRQKVYRQENLKQMQEMKALSEQLGTTISDAFIEGAKSGEKFGVTMRKVLGQVFEQLLRGLVLKPLITGIGNAFVGGSAAPQGGIFSGFIPGVGMGGCQGGGGIADWIGGLFGKAPSGGWGATVSPASSMGPMVPVIGGNAGPMKNYGNNWLNNAGVGLAPGPMPTYAPGYETDIQKTWGNQLKYPTIPGMDNQTVKPLNKVDLNTDEWADGVKKSAEDWQSGIGKSASDLTGKIGAGAEDLTGKMSLGGDNIAAGGLMSETSMVTGSAMAELNMVQGGQGAAAAMQSGGGGGGLFGNLFGGGGGGGGMPFEFPVPMFAKGAAISGGNVIPHAKGAIRKLSNSIQDKPTNFPMSGGRLGLLGESGPEAILPLARAGGLLGVRTSDGGVVPLDRDASGRLTVTLPEDAVRQSKQIMAAANPTAFAMGGIVGSGYAQQATTPPTATSVPTQSTPSYVNSVTNRSMAAGGPVNITNHFGDVTDPEEVSAKIGDVVDQRMDAHRRKWQQDTVKASVNEVAQTNRNNPGYLRR
jgi:hypothetical protein